MADPIDVGWVLQCNFRGDLFGQMCITTFNYMVDALPGGGAPSNVLALTQFDTAIEVAGNLVPDYMDCMPVNYNLLAVDLQWISPLRYRKVSFTNAAGPGNGSVTTTPNLAAVITLVGERATRRSIANKHLPGLGGGDITDGFIDVAVRPMYLPILAQAQADVVAAGTTYKPIIYGRFIAPFMKCGVLQPGQAELKTPIVNGFLNATARVMRRRTVGVGK